MSWAQKIEDAPTVESKLRLVGEALDTMSPAHRIASRSKLKPIGERHLESVDVRRIFDHWCEAMGKRGNAKLTPERRTKVQARLKQGYTVQDILQAIDGCASSDFHMGRDPKNLGKVFNDLELICRSGAAVEAFKDKVVEAADPNAFLGTA